MKQYYLSNGEQPQGPFVLTELTQHKLSPDSIIWCQGMPDWLPIQMVPEVHNFLSQTPPPLPASFLAKHQSSPRPAQSNPISSTPQQKINQPIFLGPKKNWRIIAGGVTVTVIAAILFFLNSNAHNSNLSINEPAGQSSYQPIQANPSFSTGSQDVTLAAAKLEGAAEAARREAEQQAIRKQAALEKQEAKREWHRQHFLDYVSTSIPSGYAVGFMGGISNGHVQFVNNSGYRLRSAVAAIEYIKPNGEVHETKYVTFGEIGAHSSALYMIPKSNRGVRVSATVYRVDVPGLNYSYDRQSAEDAETAKADYLANP